MATPLYAQIIDGKIINCNQCCFKTASQSNKAAILADAIHTLIQIEYMLKPEYRVSIEKMTSGIHFEVYPRDCINTLYHKYIITQNKRRNTICKQIAIIRKELYRHGFIADKDLRGLKWAWSWRPC